MARSPPCLATLCALALRFEILLVWGEVGGLPVTPGRHAGGTYVHRCTVVAVPVPVSVPVPTATSTTSHVALVSMCFPGLVPGGVYAGHAAHKPNDAMVKQLLFGHSIPGHPRPMGRPHLTWMDTAMHDIGRTLQINLPRDWANLALHRVVWRGVVSRC